MAHRFRLLVSTLALGAALDAHAAVTATPDTLQVTVENIADGARIPATHAVCLPTRDGMSNTKGTNLRPAIHWSAAPKGTKSLALFVMDPDVPADFTDAGKPGKTIDAQAARKDFFHFAVIDLPATATRLPAGNAGDKLSAGTALVNDMGLNSYVKPSTAFGGPCPPWNDARLHHYHFIVMALDENAPLRVSESKDVTPAESQNNAAATYARLTRSAHVLARGESVGTYTLNPSLMAQ